MDAIKENPFVGVHEELSFVGVVHPDFLETDFRLRLLRLEGEADAFVGLDSQQKDVGFNRLIEGLCEHEMRDGSKVD